MSHTKHHDHKELALRLQTEVDGILNMVEKKDEQGLFAEFHEHELVEITGSDHKPIIKEAIDERIMIRLNRTSPSHTLIKKTEHVGKKVHKAVNYLFKPFEI